MVISMWNGRSEGPKLIDYGPIRYGECLGPVVALPDPCSAAVFEDKRHHPGSVVEIASETFPLVSSWGSRDGSSPSPDRQGWLSTIGVASGDD